MDYKITMLTVSQPIPSASSGTGLFAPWSTVSGKIVFQNPVLSTISITDDDPVLTSRQYSQDPSQQALTHDTTFGHGATAVTLPAGTKMQNFISSVIADSQGNSFVMLFPRTYDAPNSAPILGGKHSVLVFPQPKTNPDTGEVTYPVFDLQASYSLKSIKTIQNAGRDAEPYPPQSPAPCFAQGTMIDTIFGPRAIETLSVGDMIRTRDNGYRWLSWIGATPLDAARLELQPNLRPIRIRAGALANGVPARDLTVSPQHRMLVRSSIAQRMFGEAEILVAAKHLVGLPGIEILRAEAGVTYWHMLFDGHEVVMSDGAWTESLFTGPQAMEAVGPAARREIVALFPQLQDPGFTPDGARRMLNGREGRRLAERHARHQRQLVEEI
ncbi:Hint domain-containing protein [Paracoccus spongiarum]|uniref:Hint domain-containing protein n=1 Tax=Paracoccus spongiarum TaxID=3064387 RepID=A0ABT9J843_9RHOB|nr:Hint domain-containing protein [Paracoccus sp. 2205BS29-5]MDP5305977.1 Hint domain-containing protein [Paracoccus sp. 2205BS29-5]